MDFCLEVPMEKWMKKGRFIEKEYFLFLPQGSIRKYLDLNLKTKMFCWKLVSFQKCFRNI